MATASKTEKVIRDFTYTLTLTEEEARTIYDICFRHVVGSCSSSRRRHVDEIFYALDGTGLRAFGFADDAEGLITFRDSI